MFNTAWQVPEAIATCTKAGISVHMVSGDNIVTAKAVALKSGIMHPDGDSVVYTGKDFNNFIRDPDGTVRRLDLNMCLACIVYVPLCCILNLCTCLSLLVCSFLYVSVH